MDFIHCSSFFCLFLRINPRNIHQDLELRQLLFEPVADNVYLDLSRVMVRRKDVGNFFGLVFVDLLDEFVLFEHAKYVINAPIAVLFAFYEESKIGVAVIFLQNAKAIVGAIFDLTAVDRVVRLDHSVPIEHIIENLPADGEARRLRELMVTAKAQALALYPLALIELSRRLKTHLTDAMHLKVFHLAEVEVTRSVTLRDELALGEAAISPVTLELLASLVSEPTKAMMLPDVVEVSLEDGPIILFLDDLICLEATICDN
jgi:hypothetical protein